MTPESAIYTWVEWRPLEPLTAGGRKKPIPIRTVKIDLKIDVVIPSIPPRTPLLKRALESVWAQTTPPAGVSIAIDYDREGAAVTRNRAMAGGRSPWVAFLDDDDEFYPQHLRRLAEHQLETGADVVWPWFDCTSGFDPFPENEGRQWDPDRPHSFPITALVRREAVEAVGGFPLDTPGIVAGEDQAFWRALSKLGARFAHLPERTWLWHHDSRNTSGLPTRW